MAVWDCAGFGLGAWFLLLALGLARGESFEGMAPCGPLYFPRRTPHAQGPFRIRFACISWDRGSGSLPGCGPGFRLESCCRGAFVSAQGLARGESLRGNGSLRSALFAIPSRDSPRARPSLKCGFHEPDSSTEPNQTPAKKNDEPETRGPCAWGVPRGKSSGPQGAIPSRDSPRARPSLKCGFHEPDSSTEPNQTPAKKTTNLKHAGLARGESLEGNKADRREPFPRGTRHGRGQAQTRAPQIQPLFPNEPARCCSSPTDSSKDRQQTTGCVAADESPARGRQTKFQPTGLSACF